MTVWKMLFRIWKITRTSWTSLYNFTIETKTEKSSWKVSTKTIKIQSIRSINNNGWLMYSYFKIVKQDCLIKNNNMMWCAGTWPFSTKKICCGVPKNKTLFVQAKSKNFTSDENDVHVHTFVNERPVVFKKKIVHGTCSKHDPQHVWR